LQVYFTLFSLFDMKSYKNTGDCHK